MHKMVLAWLCFGTPLEWISVFLLLSSKKPEKHVASNKLGGSAF